MTGEEIAVKLAEHEKEIGSLKHRMDEVEEVTDSINNLAISVEKLALSVTGMLERMDSYESRLKVQGERIGVLERLPDKEAAERWRSIVKTIITAVASGLVGMVLAQLF